MYLRGIGKLGFVASKNVGCPAGSVPSGMIAASGYVDCEWMPQQRIATEAPRAPSGGTSIAASVSVPTQIQTQISPQISPVFIQQSNPQGSPVGAGTAMTGATQQAGGAEMLAFLREQEANRQAEALRRSEEDAQRRADESARQDALLEEFRAAQEAGEAGPALPTLMPTGAGGAPPSEEDKSAIPVQTAGFGGGGFGIPLLALAAAAGVFFIAGGTGKGKSGKRKSRKRK